MAEPIVPQTPAAGIAKGVEAKTNPTTPAKTEVILKNQENGGVEIKDPNEGKKRYVVDGQDKWLTPEQADSYVQKGLAFEPKISQLGRLQQETSEFLKLLETDPAKILYNEKFGKPADVLKKILGSTKVSDEIKDALGQWYYNNVVVKEGMSPEQREAEEMKSKLAEYQAQEQQREQDRLSAEENQRVQQALQTIKAQISEAMQEAGVPMDSKIAPQLAKRVAQIMQLGFVNGKVVTPKEAMAKAKTEFFEYQKAYYDVLDEDKLVEQLGKDNAEKVRKYYLKAVKESEKEKKPNSFKTVAKRDERKTMSSDEFRDYLNELKKGK